MNDEKVLPCGCKTYTNIYGEVKIWEWVCDSHVKNKEKIIDLYKKDGFHGMRLNHG